MIKQAVKKGDFVKCEIQKMSGKIYQIVDFNDFIYLVDVDKIAEGLEALTPADFWKVSPQYFKENFSIANQETANPQNFVSLDELEGEKSEEELSEIFWEVRQQFEKKTGLFCDASDVGVLTVFPCKNLGDDYDEKEVKNYIVGLYNGKPALKFNNELFVSE